MIGKIDCISKDTKNLPERVQAIEFAIQKLSQSFDKVTEYTSRMATYMIPRSLSRRRYYLRMETLRPWNHRCRMGTRKFIP